MHKFPLGSRAIWQTSVFIIALLFASHSFASKDCNNVAVITGFWPPTNEMLRQWSTSPAQNPEGWQGANWRGLGYDVYAFFPEFPPDGDPTNDNIGDPGSVGSVSSDFQVDYQDASADFWRIMDEYQPRILITTSRGGDIQWELEAIEGGHSTWISDRYGSQTHPLPGTVERRTTDAITRYADVTIDSKLPLLMLAEELRKAFPNNQIEIDKATSGNYLSGFVGLHGIYYSTITATNLTAGHIHVGKTLPIGEARALMQKTVELVLAHYPSCQ